MNKDNLHQIFNYYIEKFDFLNSEPHTEYYKWQICKQYPTLMSEALNANDDTFAAKLYEVKKCTRNIIDSYLFKQNSHSVSSYLFLNDPENHYMYKATQCRDFADCVEYYSDWGSGDNIKLDVFYRMMDEMIEEISNCKELLETDKSRFDGRLNLPGGEIHQDINKHILAFDIIYCFSSYNLYGGINYTKRNMKEKKLYLEMVAKKIKH